MAILNPSFEEEGVLPGEAAHWTLTAVTSLEAVAGFGTTPEQAWEAFERWFELAATLGDVATARAFFGVGVDGFEAFEVGWGSGAFLWDLLPAQVVVAEFGPDAVEDCESGWNNEGFAWAWTDVSAITGQFDGEPREDFEDQWAGNQGLDWSWSTVASAIAWFDSGQNREDFENDWTPAATI